jgi:hypothetical protein
MKRISLAAAVTLAAALAVALMPGRCGRDTDVDLDVESLL